MKPSGVRPAEMESRYSIWLTRSILKSMKWARDSFRIWQENEHRVRRCPEKKNKRKLLSALGWQSDGETFTIDRKPDPMQVHEWLFSPSEINFRDTIYPILYWYPLFFKCILKHCFVKRGGWSTCLLEA